MWIRSQDRTILRNVNDLFIDNNKSGYMVCSDLNSIILGEYSTEEKAMKVMDMIENAIIEHEISNFKIKIIFYMPKDDEVYL